MMANMALEIAHHYGCLTLPAYAEANVSCDVMSALSRAVFLGDLGAVQLLLVQGARVNSPSRVFDDQRGVWRWESPVITAARLGHLEVLKALLDMGAMVDHSDPAIGKSPLHWACARGHMDTCKFLITSGACVNKTDFYSETPVVEAIGRRDLGMVRLLVDSGAKLNVTLNYDRDSALLFALLIHEMDIAKLLLQAGASPVHVNREGDDPLMVLLRDGDHCGDLWWQLLRIVMLQLGQVLPKHVVQLRTRPASPAVDLVQSTYGSPRPLKVMCRSLVRHHLLQLSGHTSILRKVDQLPVAPWLKAYLKFEYI